LPATHVTQSDALRAVLQIPLNGYTMELRPSELESVAAGLGQYDSSREGDLITLGEAVRRLPVNDRAPAWELAVRRFGRRKDVASAAGEIGMDVLHARELLEAVFGQVAAVPPPEGQTPPAPAEGPGG
jgi:hypothetical protein